MRKYVLDLTVASVNKLSDKHVLIRLTDDKPLPEMFPGQFVEVRVDGSPTTFLRRPISINYFDKEKNEMWLLVAAVGDGTRKLFQITEGENLNCIVPLGNTFTMPQSASAKTLLVGGGVGVAPLLFLGKKIKEAGGEPTFLLGARRKEDILELDMFEQTGRVFVTTEDGSYGEKGFVTNHSILSQENFDLISTCGPKHMMMAIARYAYKNNIECEVSLENKMAGGMGACLCCVEKTTEGNTCICKEGPVMNIKKLLWQI